MSELIATQKTIARQLGISQAAVSKVLSGNTAKVSADTAAQILEAAKRMNYSKRKQNKSRFIGVMLSHVAEYRGGPYELRILSGIQEQARKLNAIPVQHILTIEESSDDFYKDVAGWVSITSIPPEKLNQIDRPIVFLHGLAPHVGFDTIVEDTHMGVRRAVRRLYELGHRSFGYFNVRPWGLSQAENYGAFHSAISELDLPHPPPEWIFTPRRKEATMADVERQQHEFLVTLKKMRSRPRALFIAGDIYALPFLRLASEYGFSIPEDFSVFGYDDIPDSALSSPSLSSIAQPLEEMGREAVERLIARINTPGMPTRTIKIPMEFKERASIGSARGTH